MKANATAPDKRGEGDDAAVCQPRTGVSVYRSYLCLSLSLHDMFVLRVPASASDVRWNETRVFVIGIQETVGALTGASQCAQFPFQSRLPFTVIIPSKAIVK